MGPLGGGANQKHSMEAEIKRWEEPGFAGLIPDQGHAAGMDKTAPEPPENDHGTAWNARGCWDFERRLGRGEGRPRMWRENDWGRAEGAEIGLRPLVLRLLRPLAPPLTGPC